MKYPTDEQIDQKKYELVREQFNCAGTVCEALGNMSEEEALTIANAMNSDVVMAAVHKVIRDYSKQLVEERLVDWISTFGETATDREEMAARESLFLRDQAS